MRSSLNALVTSTTGVAERIATPEAPFDRRAATLVLRNTATAIKHVKGDMLRGWSQDNVDALLDAASAAKPFIPLKFAETVKESAGTKDEDSFLTFVQKPIQLFHHTISSGQYNDNGILETYQLKQAVMLGGLAFAAIVTEGGGGPKLQDSEGEFWENINNASARMQSLDY